MGQGSRALGWWQPPGGLERGPRFQAGDVGSPVSVCQPRAGCPRASQHLQPAAVGPWLPANSEERGPGRGCLKETKRRRATLKPVRRPWRAPPSRCDSSWKARPLCLPRCPPPMEPGEARPAWHGGRAPGNRPSPAGRSCFLSPLRGLFLVINPAGPSAGRGCVPR